ncbi:MAG: GNAT family N-acetyltransferase [Anaerolineaceae bacterium]|nr:GNAT family N-acetyltransferase [Anaerolineaceae bacterium]
MANNLFIRKAEHNDFAPICALMESHDMVGEFVVESCLIAEQLGEVVGFIRVEKINQLNYIRPIIVSPKYQGKGIGKVLLQNILKVDQEMIVISRGSAEGFYRKFGFEAMDWEDVHLPYVLECAKCPDLNNCVPIPLRRFVKSDYF